MNDFSGATIAEEPKSHGEALHHVITHCHALAFTCDRQGRCVYINTSAERILGRPVADLLGAPIAEVLPASSQGRPGCEAVLQEVVSHTTPMQYEFSVTFGQAVRDYLVAFAPEDVSDGEIRRVHGVGIDISSVRQKLRDIRASDRRKERFLAVVAHEMRNPLSTVSVGLRVLERSLSQGQLPEVCQMMDRQVGYLSRLVGDLLDVARINQGRMHVSKAPVLLSDLVRLAFETSGPSLERGQHAVRISIPDEPVTLCGDLERLGQVVSNLLDNAVKYTPSGGDVSLKVVLEGSDLVLTVSDNGIGIPPEQAQHIFEVFTQLDDGADNRRGGLGIGLYLVKMIVEAHGGTIEVSSDGVGKGSAFRVRIPRGWPQ